MGSEGAALLGLGFQGPVFPSEALNSGKFAGVSRDQGRAGPERLGRDQDIIGADGRARGGEDRPQIAGGEGVIIGEGRDLNIARQENAESFGVLLAMLSARNPIPEFE